MAITYVNDLRLSEMDTGDNSGTWGTVTNTNLELIGEALGFGTEAITTNADTHASTIADGSTDPVRAMYVKYTGTLDSACTITIGPNTVNKFYYIENATSGSQNIIISQGSGANVTIPAGDVKAVYLDGAGSGAAVTDAFASLNVVDLKVQDDLTVTDDMTVGGTLGVTGVLTATAGFASTDASTIIAADGAADNQFALIIKNEEATDDRSYGLYIQAGSTVTDSPLHLYEHTGSTQLFRVSGTGQALFTDGSASLPSVTNIGDTNTGMFFPAADTLALTSGAVEAIRMTGSGGITVNNAQNANVNFVIKAGSSANALQIDGSSGAVTINEAGADADFRVESVNHDNLFFVDAGNDGIGIGNSSIIDWSTNYPGLQMGQAGVLYGHKTSNQMSFAMNWGVTTGNVFVADGIASRMVMDTSKIAFDSSASGSAAGTITAIPLFQMTPAAGSHFNSDRGGVIDFRVSSGSKTHMLFVDSGEDAVAVGSSTVDRGMFHVNHINNGNFFDDPHIALTFNASPTDNASSSGITYATSDSDNYGYFLGAQRTSGGAGNFILKYHADSAGGTHEVFRADASGNFAFGSLIPSTSYKFIVQNSINQVSQLNYNSNASFTQDLHAWDTIRAGTSAFNFGRMRTDVGGSPDSEFIFNGAGTASADGSWNGGGADYAEYFEWSDGNPSNQDRVGISVKLEGNKIVASSSDDDASEIIGVVSGNPAVVGDTAWNKWKDKYEKDDYNRYVMEEYTFTEWTTPATDTEDAVHHIYPTDYIPSDVTVPSDATVISTDDDGNKLMRKKLNSSYDKSATYLPRSERKEWDTVGLVGKLRMTKGQKTGTNWIKMKDISDTVEEWLVR